MNSQNPRARSADFRALTVVGWLLVVTGTSHATLVGLSMVTGVPAAERPVRDVMTATSIPIAGMERSYWELFIGFSLMMAVMLVGLGSLTLLIRRAASQLAHGTRVVLVLLGLVLVPAMVISVLLLPPPPIVLLGLALATVAVGLARERAVVVEGAAGQR